MTNIKGSGTKKQLAEAVNQVWPVIADQLGGLIETCRYESCHEGKALEERIDNQLNATKGFVSDDTLQDKGPASASGKTDGAKELPDNQRITGQDTRLAPGISHLEAVVSIRPILMADRQLI